MPARPITSSSGRKTCTCAECVVENPAGVKWGVSAWAGHMAGVRQRKLERERMARQDREAESVRRSAVEEMTADIIGLVLTDDGPNLETQPSKLWTSRSEFQEQVGAHTPDPPEPVSIQEVLRSLPFGSAELDEATSSPSPPSPPKDPAPTPESKFDKRERSERTRTVLKVLTSVDTQVGALWNNLLTKPTHEVLRDVESRLVHLGSVVDKVTRSTPSIDTKKEETFTLLRRLESRVLEWRVIVPQPKGNPLAISNGKPLFLNSYTGSHFTIDHNWDRPIDRYSATAQIAIFLAVVCSVVMGVSRNGGNLIMSIITYLLYTGFSAKGKATISEERIVSELPDSITDALSKFNFDGKTTIYAVCPRCHFTYKPQFKPGLSHAIYPKLCTNKPHPGSPLCNQALLEAQPDNHSPKPLKTFVYHSFHDYLGGLLARKDLEEVMDKSCDDLKESLKYPRPEIVKDVFEAEFLRSFEWLDDGTLFIDRKGEGHYAFSFNVDFFSVEGNRHGGAKASVGIISMACLNLPLEIRYNLENMFLAGIIPGPSEPHLTQLNHYLRPVIDDLFHSWENGVLYSRTALHPEGRVTRCAVAAVVSDLPAARAVAQLAGHASHHLCSVCDCFHKTNLHRSDWQNWKQRDNNTLRRLAEQWRDAPTPGEQDAIFQKHGLRYSEFWRLPYWNPTRQLVVDGMHCILEGLTHHYFRDAMGLKEGKPSPDGEYTAFSHEFTSPHPADESHGLTRKEIDQVFAIHVLLQKPIEDNYDDWNQLTAKLKAKNGNSLIYVCGDVVGHSVLFKTKGKRKAKNVPKVELAMHLVKWVCEIVSKD
jgi:hypothetical protein